MTLPIIPQRQGGLGNGTGDASGLSVTAAGGTTSRSLASRFSNRLSALDFGAFFDGASHPLSSRFATLAAAQAVYPTATALTDEIDGLAVQAGITALGAVTGGGELVLPPGTGLQTVPILHCASNVNLVGAGVGAAQDDVVGPVPGTRLKWTGASGATMLTIAPVSNTTSGIRLYNAGIRGILLDANSIAATSLFSASLRNSTFDVGSRNAVTASFVLDTVPLAEGNDWQMNDGNFYFWNNNTDGDGLVLQETGDATLANNTKIAGNVSLNLFRRIVGATRNGWGIKLLSTDNNHFNMVDLFRLGSTGGGALLIKSVSPQFNGANVFGYLNTNGATISLDGSLTSDNRFLKLDTSNATPMPTLTNGASNPATLYTALNNSICLGLPDGTALGGGNRGANAIDLQFIRPGFDYVAGQARSMIIGGMNNRAGGADAYIIGGQWNECAGAFSYTLGQFIDAGPRVGAIMYGNGLLSVKGDAQAGFATLRAKITTTTATRLLADTNAASGANSLGMPYDNTVMKLECTVLVHSTTGQDAALFVMAGVDAALLIRGTGVSSTILVGGTFRSGAATSGASGKITPSIAVDTTAGGPNISVTVTGGTWNALAECRISEVR